MTDELRETWPAEAASVPLARAAVVAVARAAEASADALDDVRLAVSEAVTNVVMHAYVGRETGPVHVHARVDDRRRMTVEIADEGGGLRARPDSPGLGVGLPLIAAVTESVQVTGGETEASRVSMVFALDTVRTPVA